MKSYDYFLSGPITGRPDFRVRFAQASVRVRARHPGARIWNPAMMPSDREYQWYMRRCVEALFESVSVILLDGWAESPGAVAERALALSLGIPVVELANF